MFEINVIDTATAAAILKSIGLDQAASALWAGDYVGAWNLLINNLASIFAAGNMDGTLGIVIKSGLIRWFLKALPGTDRSFNLFGLIKLSL